MLHGCTASLYQLSKGSYSLHVSCYNLRADCQRKSHRQARNPLSGEWRKHSQQNIMPYHPTLTSSSVHRLFHQPTALFVSYYNVTSNMWPIPLQFLKLRLYLLSLIPIRNVKRFSTFLEIRIILCLWFFIKNLKTLIILTLSLFP